MAGIRTFRAVPPPRYLPFSRRFEVAAGRPAFSGLGSIRSERKPVRMNDDPHPVPIGDELDLHAFRPSEIGELLPEYFLECQRLGIRGVRVIHGKGTGTLRESVHALLRKLPGVQEFHYPAATGSWGATWVILKPPGPGSREDPTAG